MHAEGREPPLRLFVALELPTSWQSYLADVQREVEHAQPGELRWVRPELLHLTLIFLGDQPRVALAGISSAITEAAIGTPAFRLELGAFGSFASRGSLSVVWAAVEDGSAELNRLHTRLVECLNAAAVVFERGTFRAHVTLARGRDREQARPTLATEVSRTLQSLPRRRRPAGFPARHIVLFRGQLFASGPLYTALSEHPLALSER